MIVAALMASMLAAQNAEPAEFDLYSPEMMREVEASRDRETYLQAMGVAEQIINHHTDHPAGREVMDYYACHKLHLEHDNVLFFPSSGIILATHQIWDTELPIYPDWVTADDVEFPRLVHSFVNGAVLTRFADVGVEGCREILARHEMPLEEYLAMLDEGGRG